jgi:hypothetical protein
MAMSKPEKYIFNTDYATLANNSATITCTVSIPADAIGAGATQTYTNTATVGIAGSPIEYDINYSLTAHRWKGNSLSIVENDSLPTQYQGIINVYRNSATTITVQVVLFNGSASSITKTARTVTVRVRSFIPPF